MVNEMSSSSSLTNNNNNNSSGPTAAAGDVSGGECCSLTLSSSSSTTTTTSNCNMAADTVTKDKYQRLAQEYAKLRAQLVVLKKGVIDEQNRNQELHQSIKSYDQNQRRLEQEVQGLLFRNQQLTKRIQVLQSDLEMANSQPAGSHSKHKSTGSTFGALSSLLSSGGSNNSTSSDSQMNTAHVNLVDELNKQLISNSEKTEHYRQMTIDIEQQRAEQVQQLNEQINQMKKDLDMLASDKHSQMNQLKADLEKIQQDKCLLQNNFDQVLAQLNESLINVEHLRTENHNLKQELNTLKQSNDASTHSHSNRQSESQSNKQVVNAVPVLLSNHNKLYNQLSKRQQVIEQLTSNVSELICALSTLHSNISQKILIMYALFNKNSNHLYFLDYCNVNGAGSDETLVSSTVLDSSNCPTHHQQQQQSHSEPALDISSQHRSLSVMAILKKFRDYLKLGYDTYLVHLEDTSNQYSELKIRQQLLLYGTMATDEPDRTEFNAVEQEITETSIDIGETFADYVSYLNKLNIYLTICLNMWSKQYRQYDPNNTIIQTVLDARLQSNLSDLDKRDSLAEKNEMLIHSISNCIRIIGQICNHVQLLLSKSLLKCNFLSVFNELMHRVDALERSLEDTKRAFSSKVVLEHDLLVTIEPELKSMDDCILSSLVFVSKCVQQIRILLETHYFFFVEQCVDQSTASTTNNIIQTDQTDNSCSTMKHKSEHQIMPGFELALDDQLDAMQDKLTCCQKRLAQMEKEKEHWSIEAQLNLVKLQRQQKRCQDLQEQLEQIKQQDNNKPASLQTTNCDASPAAASSTPTSPLNDVQLMEHMELVDAKAMAYWNDCQALKQRFLEQWHKCNNLEQQFTKQQTLIDDLKEEYRTSVHNYEEKLQAMSEHIATLNDTLTKQSEQIDCLSNSCSVQPAPPSKPSTKNIRKSFMSSKRTSS